MKHLIILVFCNLFIINSYSQSFQNGDLEGTVNVNQLGTLPVYWQNVPYTDVNCLALNFYEDSPDLTSLNAPNPGGINGNPYSGLTFISGLFGTQNNANNFWHEGIMQTVSGFIVENSYSIRFHQTVVRNLDAMDKSGSWAVYIDDVLAGITYPTYSNEPIGSISLHWEARGISFTATATSHLVKFLPMDDDSNWVFSTTDTLGALRMGIDSIGFVLPTGINEISGSIDFSLFPNPNSGSFKLQYNGVITKPLLLFISDVYGKLIDTKEILNTTTDYENASLNIGLYFYSLRQGNEEVGRGKFVVVK